jgi:hypothetical protein
MTVNTARTIVFLGMADDPFVGSVVSSLIFGMTFLIADCSLHIVVVID